MSGLNLHTCRCEPKCLEHTGFCPTCEVCGQYIDAIFWKYAPFSDPKSRKFVKEFEGRRVANYLKWRDAWRDAWFLKPQRRAGVTV